MISYPLRAAGIGTRVIEAGHDGPPVLFLHGVGARADRWATTLHLLDGYRGFAVDWPGHGFADKRHDLHFDCDASVGFIAGTLDALKLDRVALVGTSYGGLMAGHFAARFPERVVALALVGTLGLSELDEAARSRTAAALQASTLEAIRAKLRRLVFDGTLVDDRWVREEWLINTSAGASDALAALARFIEDDDGLNAASLMPLLPALLARMPVAMIWGREDRSVSVTLGEHAHASFPAIRWTSIDAACHAPYMEQPQQFADALDVFLHEALQRAPTKSKE